MAAQPAFWSKFVGPLAVAGLVPFALALGAAVFPGQDLVEKVVLDRALIGFGALSLAFLGGVRWGARMQGGAGNASAYVLGVAGTVLGFVVLFLPVHTALMVLAVAFGAHGAWDVWAAHRGEVPRHYGRLRQNMTWGVVGLLLAILAAEALVPGPG